jgi:hypothetical protein
VDAGSATPLLADHVFGDLFKEHNGAYPLAISTDDSGVFNTSLSHGVARLVVSSSSLLLTQAHTHRQKCFLLRRRSS